MSFARRIVLLMMPRCIDLRVSVRRRRHGHVRERCYHDDAATLCVPKKIKIKINRKTL